MKWKSEEEEIAVLCVSGAGVVHLVADESDEELTRRGYWLSECGWLIAYGIYSAPVDRILMYGGKRLCRLCFPQT